MTMTQTHLWQLIEVTHHQSKAKLLGKQPHDDKDLFFSMFHFEII